MSAKSDFRIVVLPGDGIGVEVMDACLAVLAPLQRKVGGFSLALRAAPRRRAARTATPASRFPTRR